MATSVKTTEGFTNIGACSKKQYCNLRKNITFERHKFNTRNQEQTKTKDQYATILRTLASTCEFNNLKDGLIGDRMICGINIQTLHDRFLRESDLTLEKTLDICRAAEHFVAAQDEIEDRGTRFGQYLVSWWDCWETQIGTKIAKEAASLLKGASTSRTQFPRGPALYQIPGRR